MVQISQKDDTGLGRGSLEPNAELFLRYQTNGGFAQEVGDVLHLCKGKLTRVYTNDVEVKEASGWATFRGMTIKTLNFEFTGAPVEPRPNTKGKEGIYVHSFTPIDPANNTMFKGNRPSTEVNFNSIMSYLMHFGHKLLGDARLDFPLDEAFDGSIFKYDKYKAISGEDIIKAYNTFFESIVKKYYTKATKEVEAALIPAEKGLWIKLTLPQNVDKARFSFPNLFPKRGGVIEVFASGVIPTDLKYDRRYDFYIPSKTSPTANLGGGNNAGSPSSAVNDLLKEL